MSDKTPLADILNGDETKDDAMIGAIDRLAAALERIAAAAEKQEQNRPLRKG